MSEGGRIIIIEGTWRGHVSYISGLLVRGRPVHLPIGAMVPSLLAALTGKERMASTRWSRRHECGGSAGCMTVAREVS